MVKLQLPNLKKPMKVPLREPPRWFKLISQATGLCTPYITQIVLFLCFFWVWFFTYFGCSFLFILIAIMVPSLYLISSYMYQEVKYEKRKLQYKNLHHFNKDRMKARHFIEEVFGFVPVSLYDPQFETVNWLNKSIAFFWPYIKGYAEDQISSKMQEIFYNLGKKKKKEDPIEKSMESLNETNKSNQSSDSDSDSDSISSGKYILDVVSVDIGTLPPTLTAFKVIDSRREETPPFEDVSIIHDKDNYDSSDDEYKEEIPDDLPEYLKQELLEKRRRKLEEEEQKNTFLNKTGNFFKKTGSLGIKGVKGVTDLGMKGVKGVGKIASTTVKGVGKVTEGVVGIIPGASDEDGRKRYPPLKWEYDYTKWLENLDTENEFFMFDCEFEWFMDSEWVIQVDSKAFPSAINVGFGGLYVNARVRITLEKFIEPKMKKIPPCKVVSFSFLTKPRIDFDTRPKLTWLGPFLDKIKEAVSNATVPYMFPSFINIMQFHGGVSGRFGEEAYLKFKVVECRKLVDVETIRSNKPFVNIKLNDVYSKTVKKKRTKTDRDHSSNPQFNEEYEWYLKDSSNFRSITFVVRSEGLMRVQSEEIGRCKISIEEIREKFCNNKKLKENSHTMELTHRSKKMGVITVQFKYINLKEEKEKIKRSQSLINNSDEDIGTDNSDETQGNHVSPEKDPNAKKNE